MVAFLNRHAHLLQSLHVSNEYTGFLPDTDDTTEVVVIRKPQKRLEMTFKCKGVSAYIRTSKVNTKLMDLGTTLLERMQIHWKIN